MALLSFFELLTKNVPMIDATIPSAAISIGRRMRLSIGTFTNPAAIDATTASPMVAMIDPTYDSYRSAPIPAMSPTLSPTLSAITAGFLGSSSGIPASTLPTRSAPTSAALVKIPPPTRAKRAIELAPSENPKSTFTVLVIPKDVKLESR